jgi:hypothetical protein
LIKLERITEGYLRKTITIDFKKRSGKTCEKMSSSIGGAGPAPALKREHKESQSHESFYTHMIISNKRTYFPTDHTQNFHNKKNFWEELIPYFP